MASRETVLARSAMSMGNKINIMVAEGSRILRNCSTDLPWSIRTRHLDNLMISMMWTGYLYNVRSIVIQRVLARYDNNIINFKTQGRPLYRTREERIHRPKENKAIWFREGGATATVVIPCTPGSVLANQVRQVLKQHRGPVGTSVRVVDMERKT